MEWGLARYGHLDESLENKMHFIRDNVKHYNELKQWYKIEHLPEKISKQNQQERLLKKVTARNQEIKTKMERINEKLLKWKKYQTLKHGGSNLGTQTMSQMLIELHREKIRI